MTDSPPDNSTNRHTVGREAFARFLDSLSPETEEASRLYTRLHEKLVGLFSLKGLSDPVNAADETIDRAALKISAGAPVPDVGKYCMGIARNIVKERLRRIQREHSAFLHFVNDPSSASDEQLDRIYSVLKPCFEELSLEEQQLLAAYCQVMQGRARAECRRQLALTMQTTMLALRMRVTRLRTNLANCVKKRTNEG